MIRLLLLFVLFWMGCFLVGAFDKSGRSVNDFERVEISNYRSYPKTTNGGSRYIQIVIEADGKEYFLFPHDELMPEGVGKFADILPLLDRSTEAVLWVEESQGRHWVMGIEADGRLIISPTQGVKFHEKERRVALWVAFGWFVMFILGYFYFKKHYRLDWKLSRITHTSNSKSIWT